MYLLKGDQNLSRIFTAVLGRKTGENAWILSAMSMTDNFTERIEHFRRPSANCVVIFFKYGHFSIVFNSWQLYFNLQMVERKILYSLSTREWASITAADGRTRQTANSVRVKKCIPMSEEFEFGVNWHLESITCSCQVSTPITLPLIFVCLLHCT